jgi:hypothetical protein
MALESKLYKTVEQFAKEEFGCQVVKQQIGTRLGKVDVVGFRQIHGDLGTISELIAIEIKEENASFLKAIGQARAYSIYAHKCYLAYRKRYSNRFTSAEKDIASQLGVGLIEIKADQSNVIATSQSFSPQEDYVLTILDKMRLFRCTLCHAVYTHENMTAVNSKDEINPSKEPAYLGKMKQAIKNHKNIEYYLFHLNSQNVDDEREYVHERRYLCKDCASIFASLSSIGKD